MNLFTRIPSAVPVIPSKAEETTASKVTRSASVTTCLKREAVGESPSEDSELRLTRVDRSLAPRLQQRVVGDVVS